MTIEKAEKDGKIIGFTLVTDEIEVFNVLKNLGRERYAKSKNINGLFVGDTSNGDYSKVYGFSGVVPHNDKLLYTIK